MGKYDKYYITDLMKPGLEMPTKDATRFLWMDDDIIKGAFYMECVWFWPHGDWGKPGGIGAHTHDWDEIIGFFGSNPDDPRDLCGEIELWMGGEKHVMTNSFITFVPAGTEHCPLRINRVDRPIFHITTGPGGMYTKTEKKK
jgi:hypothetical protein